MLLHSHSEYIHEWNGSLIEVIIAAGEFLKEELGKWHVIQCEIWDRDGRSYFRVTLTP